MFIAEEKMCAGRKFNTFEVNQLYVFFEPVMFLNFNSLVKIDNIRKLNCDSEKRTKISKAL